MCVGCITCSPTRAFLWQAECTTVPSTAVNQSELYLREIVLRRDDVPDVGRYPFALPAVANLTRLPFEQPVTFLIGENGAGKSTLLEAMAYGPRALHEQSHGESFLALVQNRFRGSGLYLLDEPEAALSPTRQMSLVARIHALVERRSQFIIATHSPILLAYPRATIYHCGPSGLQAVAYEDTEHFRVTRDFLTRYPTMLRTLLGDDVMA